MPYFRTAFGNVSEAVHRFFLPGGLSAVRCEMGRTPLAGCLWLSVWVVKKMELMVLQNFAHTGLFLGLRLSV